MYNTTVADLIELNDLDGTIIIEGQILKVPESKGTIVTVYTIEQGDTLATIFVKLGVDYEFLNEYPGLLELKLQPGQQITVGFSRNLDARKQLEKILIDNNITSDELILLNSNWLNQEIKYK